MSKELTEAQQNVNDLIHFAFFNVAYKLRIHAIARFIARRLA